MGSRNTQNNRDAKWKSVSTRTTITLRVTTVEKTSVSMRACPYCLARYRRMFPDNVYVDENKIIHFFYENNHSGKDNNRRCASGGADGDRKETSTS